MSLSPAIVVEQVVKRYGTHTAVDGISFQVPRGQVYGILGPNGAGKSTTIRMINDIIAPDGGQITLLDGLRPGGEAATRIGYLPEERGLYPKMRVLDMIKFMGELRGLSAHDARTRAGAWLERLGLAQWAKNRVDELSKGMQQKVQFATALIHDPELVILDEPWSGLDPINAEVLREVVDELRVQGRTVLFSTHGMEQAEKICDAVCIIARGKTVLDGTLRDIKRAAGSGRSVALGFIDAAAHQRANDGPLVDAALVDHFRAAEAGEHADTIAEIAREVAPQALLAALVGAGIGITRFEVIVPTLHQIFVAKVGIENAVVAERHQERERQPI